MKILVTGASGYLGNKLVHRLASLGNQVHALVRTSAAKDWLQHPAITIFEGDILNKESLSAAMKGCKQVYHTASLVKLWAKSTDVFYTQNSLGTQYVVEAALKEGAYKLVYTSTCGVWSSSNDHTFIESDPRINAFDNDYDLSKFIAEKTIKEAACRGMFAVIVNPPRLYGPGIQRESSAVNCFIVQLLKNKIALLPWRLETKANYAFIDDVVDRHILAMQKGLGGERYILGGENISYQTLIDALKMYTLTKNIYLRVPELLLKAYAYLELLRGRMSGHEPVITPAVAKRLQTDRTFDCTKAIRQLGYAITPFEEGMRITLNHLKKTHNV